ncbi:MAG: hypothetical protein AABX77_00060 [Nanoarchaeota archaeon]
MNLEEYLTQKTLIEKVLTIDEITAMSKKNKNISIEMGQTFDEGQPLEMIKYALFIMNLQDLISQQGASVSSHWIIADHFMTSINKDKEIEQAKKQAKDRVDFLELLNKTYNGNIGSIYSSDLSKLPEYQENLSILKIKIKEDEIFRSRVSKSVPEDRRNNPEAINYSLEELAVIQTMKTDIKIGPKSEIMYDEPARKFAPLTSFKKFSAIHLTNSYLFGDPKIPDNVKKEIEEFGILPYKKNSKGLGEYRIDPVNDSLDRITNLINNTEDRRTLIGLAQTCKLISMKLGEDFNYKIPNDLKSLKKLSINLYDKYIKNPLVKIY